MKISNLQNLNINLRIFVIIASLTIVLSSPSILGSQSTYSQTTEDPKSLNCKDNKDQSQYVSNVTLANGTGRIGPITDDLPGFHYIKKI